MKIPNAAHEGRPWVMARIASDLTLLDVWDLPVEGERDEFGAFVELVSSLDPYRAKALPVRLLFRTRAVVGRLLRLDDDRRRPIPGATETTLAERLPAALTGTATADREPGGSTEGFVPLFQTADEWAAEISNRTVHGVLQLTWVEQPDGWYRGRLAVYVKPRGVAGTAYLRFIGPFRHLIVYPALLREIGAAWVGRRPRG